MAGYIKTHSNYRLQSRHQVVNDGIILERDISTVGGVNSFATGQATVYQSGNFVMVVNNSSSASRHIRKKGWLSSGDDNDTWNQETLLKHSSDINGSVEKSIMLKNDFMDLRSFAYYGSLADLIQNTVLKIVSTFPYELYYDKNSSEIEVKNGENTILLKRLSNPGQIDIHNTSLAKGDNNSGLGHFYNGGYTNYEIFTEESGIDNAVGFEWKSRPVQLAKVCPKPWEKFADITITVESWEKTITIYAYWDDNLDIVYLTNNEESFHITPRTEMGHYDDFVDNLDLFGKCLVGVYSGIRNTSKFEVLQESDKGTRRSVRVFTIPTGPGGYNINSDSTAMRNYISDLGQIGITYDELYTDNLFRMMTHESLKNLDWTKSFNGNDKDDETNEYIKSGEKFSSVIRIMGYTFDQEKAYIDSIGNVNTVTYSNRDNLSDYFLTDAVETDGICVNTIYPYELTEYDLSGNTVNPSAWTENNQSDNEYYRKFSENTADIIIPYGEFTGAFYTKCVSGESQTIEIQEYDGRKYFVEDGNVYSVITDYHNPSEMSIPDVNNEFIKRLKINSRHILRKKGTIEGIESMLSLFGMRSNRWCEGSDMDYDFRVTESTCFAKPIIDEMDDVHGMYRIDWYNSCKTIPYDTESYINGEYIPYQGLPVAYRQVQTVRRLYPFFQQGGVYDGNMYYQMNGGWIGYLPYRFDIDDKILSGGTRVETMRNIMQVKDLTELASQPIGDLFDNSVYYVTDTSERFALINGYPYQLYEESVSGDVKYYFEVEIQAGSVSIGGELYEGTIAVSGIDSGNTYYDLSLYEDGTPLRIYYTGNRNNAFNIQLGNYSPTSSLIFINGTYDGNENTKSHYFILKNTDNSSMIGEGCWEEIPSNSDLYQKIENITDNTLANNPHSGNMLYDNGEEYLNRFRKLFKYASEYRYFNESCFPYVENAYEEIDSYGFSGMTELTDTKSHSFCDVIEAYSVEIPHNEAMKINGKVYYYAEIDIGPRKTITVNTHNVWISQKIGQAWILSKSFTNAVGTATIRLVTKDKSTFAASYQYKNEKKYNIDTNASLYSIPDYAVVKNIIGADGATSQIINTKKIDLTFYLHSDTVYDKDGQEEIKYLQCKVMPYVEQMIPSTSIVNVHFEPRIS